MMRQERQHRAMGNKVIRLARQAARSFRLHCAAVRINEAMKEFGNCDDTGAIEIRLTNLKNQRLLSEYTIRDTMAHELAHLEDMTHSKGHKALTSAIKVWLWRRW